MATRSLGNSVTSAKGIFSDCTSLTSVDLGNSIVTIGSRFFEGCTSLASIEIPDSVTTIGSSAFYGCTSLADVYYEGSEEDWAEISIGSSNSCLTSATIHYNSSMPDGDESSEDVDIAGSTVTLSETSFTYDGTAKTPSVALKIGDVEVPSSAYSVSYDNNTNAGTATVTVTAVEGSGFTGTASAEFTIEQASIEDAKVELSATSCTYNGSVQVPGVTVTDASGAVLAEGSDYTVAYSDADSTDAGSYTVTVTAAAGSNYSGSAEASYEIAAKSVSSATVTLSAASKVYTGSAVKCGVKSVKLTVGGKTVTLEAGVDYDVSYSGNKAVGKAKVKITFKGNYTGSVTKTFKVVPKKVAAKSAKSSAKKKLTVKWGKLSSASVTKYQVRYRVKGTSKWKTKAVSKSKASVTLSGLKSGKKYQVQVRAYKTASGKKYYGAWSTTMTVKVR